MTLGHEWFTTCIYRHDWKLRSALNSSEAWVGTCKQVYTSRGVNGARCYGCGRPTLFIAWGDWGPSETRVRNAD